MAKGPKLIKVKLKPCCRQALKRIKEKIEAGAQLKRMLIGAPWFLLVFGSMESTAGSMAGEATVGVDSWDIWGRAIKGVPAIVRSRCKHIAGMEYLKHQKGDAQLRLFWKAMYDRF